MAAVDLWPLERQHLLAPTQAGPSTSDCLNGRLGQICISPVQVESGPSSDATH